MRRSSWLNIGCIIVLSVSVVLFFNNQPWWGLLGVFAGAVLGILAGQAMTHEPPRRSRFDEDE